MIQSCDSLDLQHSPLASESTDTSSFDTTTTPTTVTSITNSPNDFSDEAKKSAVDDSRPMSTTRGQPLLAAADASSSNSESQYPPDIKSGFDELCPVCGDKVSGYHYGLLTCESCKGFFKRTVQNKKVYSCVDNRSCHIDKSQRKRCPYCRFQKCLNVGMKLEAVRQDRMRGGRNKFGPMYKRDRAMKQQQMRHQQRMIADCELSMGAPSSPIDVKPDPALLQASMNMGFSNNSLTPGGHSNSPTDISPMTVAMAAAVASGGGSPLAPGNSYSSISQQGTGSSGINRGSMQVNTSGSNSPLHLDNSVMNLHNHHSPPHSANNSSLHQNGTGANGHLHSHSQSMSDAFLIQPSHRQTFASQSGCLSVNGNSQRLVMDALRAYGAHTHVHQPVLPSLMVELKANLLDEEEVKQKMLNFLTDTVRQVDGSGHPEQLLPVMCRMVDQLLFLMVEWARNSPFFKEMKVEDQMKLLQHSWNEILILDFIYRQVQDYWGTDLVLGNGLMLNFDVLDKLGLADVRTRLYELIKKSRELKLDKHEYMCLKFLILLNPDVSGLENRLYVEQSQEKVNAALLEYCLNFYPEMKDKFGQILLRLPEIRIISIRLEEFLYIKHLNNQVPDQTLLTEMLHSKRK